MASTLLIPIIPKSALSSDNSEPVLFEQSVQKVFQKVIHQVHTECKVLMGLLNDFEQSEKKYQLGMMDEEELETYLYTKSDTIEQIREEFYNVDTRMQRKIRIYVRETPHLAQLFPEFI